LLEPIKLLDTLLEVHKGTDRVIVEYDMSGNRKDMRLFFRKTFYSYFFARLELYEWTGLKTKTVLESELFDAYYKPEISINLVQKNKIYKADIAGYMSTIILIYHVTKAYKGWYYLRGLPIHGQRTWTNARSAYRCNKILHKEILRRCAAYYGNFSTSDLLTGFMAEVVNQRWFEHWWID